MNPLKLQISLHAILVWLSSAKAALDRCATLSVTLWYISLMLVCCLMVSKMLWKPLFCAESADLRWLSKQNHYCKLQTLFFRFTAFHSCWSKKYVNLKVKKLLIKNSKCLIKDIYTPPSSQMPPFLCFKIHLNYFFFWFLREQLQSKGVQKEWIPVMKKNSFAFQ